MKKKDNYPWLDAFCLSMPGVTKDYKEEWQAERYLLGNKMFAMVYGDKEGLAIISLKLEPEFGFFLRQQYQDIVPGYYMNKEHWNSLYLQGKVPDKVLKEMIEESYRLVFSGLSKKAQLALTASRD